MAPVTSFSIVFLLGNFFLPLTDNMTRFSFLPAKIDHMTSGCSVQDGHGEL